MLQNPTKFWFHVNLDLLVLPPFRVWLRLGANYDQKTRKRRNYKHGTQVNLCCGAMGSRLKTSGKQKPHKSISETSSITCPALNCKQEVFAKKKYRQHLTDTYREENLRDLSPFGQTELSSSTNTLTRSQPRQVRTQAKRHRTALTDEPKESSKAWQTLSFTLLAQLTDRFRPNRQTGFASGS